MSSVEAFIDGHQHTCPDIAPHRSAGIDDALLYQLTHKLQSTLELTTLLEIFSTLAAQRLPHSGLSLYATDLGETLSLGHQGPHSHNQRILLPGEQRSLGTLRLSRAQVFEAHEIKLLTELCAFLAYPLRNALLYQQALKIAATDPLTGINNRSVFASLARREIGLARRHNTALSMICADIDYFKRVNDRYGHAAGDAVIVQVANIISGCIRATDVLFRYGGEEFVILLTNTSRQGAARLARRIQRQVANCPCRHGRQTIRVSLSQGVCTLGPHDDANSLFQRADQAMYAAKRAGRNRVCIAG